MQTKTYHAKHKRCSVCTQADIWRNMCTDCMSMERPQFVGLPSDAYGQEIKLNYIYFITLPCITRYTKTVKFNSDWLATQLP